MTETEVEPLSKVVLMINNNGKKPEEQNTYVEKVKTSKLFTMAEQFFVNRLVLKIFCFLLVPCKYFVLQYFSNLY